MLPTADLPNQRPDLLVLAIDMGTSSTRTALFDRQGNRLPGTMMQEPYRLLTSAQGAAELDPATLEAAVAKCLAATLRKTGRRPVVSVGVSCFWHSLLGCDKAGKPLTPIYTWADGRCREDAARLRAEITEADYHAQTGCMLRASFWPAKLRWLARTEPKLFARVACWMSPAEWIEKRFCAKGGTQGAFGMATGTGLFNPRTLEWERDLLALCKLDPAKLPVIGEEPVRLRADKAKIYPALQETLWWPAIGDGAASNLGSGATRPGRAAINLGTSGALRVMREGPDAQAPFGLFCYRVDESRFVVGGAISNAGNLRAWCCRELRLPKSDQALEKLLAARPGPVSSLISLPFWSPERAPTWCEEISGVLEGLNQNTTALDLLQATTEATYHRLAMIADLSLGVGGAGDPRDTQIIVSGGVLRSPSSLQRLADVMNRPLHASLEPEASLRGAAIRGLEKIGIDAEAASGGKLLAGENPVRPRAKYAALYSHERERQNRLEKLVTAAGKL